MKNRLQHIKRAIFFLVFLSSFFYFKLPVFADEAIQTVKFQDVNPLNYGGSENAISNPSASSVDLSSPGKIISRVLTYAIPLAGIILFVMIVIGGFEMVLGSADAKSKDAGRQRITAAVIGFMVLFAAYWIAQLIQVIFNIQFLG